MKDGARWLYWLFRITSFAKYLGVRPGDVYPILSAKSGEPKAWFVHDHGFYRFEHPATYIGKLDQGWVGFILGRRP